MKEKKLYKVCYCLEGYEEIPIPDVHFLTLGDIRDVEENLAERHDRKIMILSYERLSFEDLTL